MKICHAHPSDLLPIWRRGMRHGLKLWGRGLRRVVLSVGRTPLGALVPDKLFILIEYRHVLGFYPNLKKPSTLTEKIQWLKLEDRRPLLTILCDKLAVREFASERIGTSYLIPLLAVYRSVSEIDFNLLPEKFVLKATHDSGSVVVVSERARLDEKAARASLARFLRRDYYLQHREWGYRDVPRRIVAEQYLGSDLRDMKVYCFAGKPAFLYVSKGLTADHSIKTLFLNTSGQPADFQSGAYGRLSEGEYSLAGLTEVLLLAERLSQGFAFVRADFFVIGERVYFAEMTLYPTAGYIPFMPDCHDARLGEAVDLSTVS